MTTSEIRRDTIEITVPDATAVAVDKNCFTVALSDSRSLSVPISWFPRLVHGTQAERAKVEILGPGSALYWPDLDEVIGVEPLLAGIGSQESASSFERWLAARA